MVITFGKHKGKSAEPILLKHASYVDYKSKVPKIFITELIGYRTADEISVAVWKIVSSKNRTAFKPVKTWFGS